MTEGLRMTGEKRSSIREIASQFARLVRDNRRLVVVAVCAAVFVGILEDVLELESMRLDRAAYWLIVGHLRRPWLTPIMESFSALATPLTLLVLLLAVAAFAPGRRPGWCCAQVHHPAPASGRIPSCERERLQLPVGPFDGGDGVLWSSCLVRLEVREGP